MIVLVPASVPNFAGKLCSIGRGVHGGEASTTIPFGPHNDKPVFAKVLHFAAGHENNHCVLTAEGTGGKYQWDQGHDTNITRDQVIALAKEKLRYSLGTSGYLEIDWWGPSWCWVGMDVCIIIIPLTYFILAIYTFLIVLVPASVPNFAGHSAKLAWVNGKEDTGPCVYFDPDGGCNLCAKTMHILGNGTLIKLYIKGKYWGEVQAKDYTKQDIINLAKEKDMDYSAPLRAGFNGSALFSVEYMVV